MNRTVEPVPGVPTAKPAPGGVGVPDTGGPPIAPSPGDPDTTGEPVSGGFLTRRRFLGFGLTIAAGVAGAAVLGRLFPVYDDAAAAPAPIVPVRDAAATGWTFVVDTSRCIGCGLCVVACKEENHVPPDPEYNRTWIERHVVTESGAVLVDSPEAGIDGFPAVSTAAGAANVAIESAYFVPRLCMQCDDPPCVSVCPVGATYQTPEGIVLVDAERCIGCGYCLVACPYGARYIVPATETAPQGVAGVADKCTWCYHRISQGTSPACVEVCPVGARLFGDRSDPADPINDILAAASPEVLYPEFGTRPRVLYLGPVTAES